ncbi:hypothetical protein GCS91_28645 [Delftia tsuruhatensis]|nr:hypothetical protein GCS91_28645 [Delftia tsuruhatensis]
MLCAGGPVRPGWARRPHIRLIRRLIRHLRVANTTSSQAPAEQLCSLPSWQDDPLAKNCGDSYNP